MKKVQDTYAKLAGPTTKAEDTNTAKAAINRMKTWGTNGKVTSTDAKMKELHPVEISKKSESGDIQDELKVVEVTEHIEVNIVVGEEGTYFEDVNGGRWYVSEDAYARGLKGAKSTDLLVPCSICGETLKEYPIGGLPVCVKCIIGSNNLIRCESDQDISRTLTCKECNQECFGFSEFNKHIMIHRQMQPKIVLTDILEEDTMKAMENHLNRSVFVCRVCNKVFPSLQFLKEHFETHTNELINSQLRKSNREKKSLYKRSRLTKSHGKDASGIVYKRLEKYVCIVCMKYFKKVEILKEHHLEHKDMVSFECKLCDLYLTDIDDVKNHWIIHNKYVSREYKCETCDKVYKMMSQLQTHSYTHIKSKAYECETCNKTFMLLKNLQFHQRIHDPNYLTCGKCHRSFKSAGHMRRHCCSLRWRNFEALSRPENKDSQKPV